jgi:hypothetical protein
VLHKDYRISSRLRISYSSQNLVFFDITYRSRLNVKGSDGETSSSLSWPNNKRTKKSGFLIKVRSLFGTSLDGLNGLIFQNIVLVGEFSYWWTDYSILKKVAHPDNQPIIMTTSGVRSLQITTMLIYLLNYVSTKICQALRESTDVRSRRTIHRRK